MTEKKSCWILSFIAAMVYMASALFLWHPYYCINDDYIIRDILSGRFSGVADAHIYNVIYPFAYLLKILYKITKCVDVWGGVLWLLMYFCLFLILHRVLEKTERYKLAGIIAVYLFFTIFSLFGAVYFTFTLTGAMCAVTGLFLFITDDEILKVSHYVPVIILLLLSFCIRKDTFMMVFPFFILWVGKSLVKKREKQVLIRCIPPIIIFAVSLGALWGCHWKAYTDDSWKTFLEFRSLRKAVHDYNGYPDYNLTQDLYEDMGISYEEYMVVGTTGAGGVNTALDFSEDVRTILKKVGEYNAAKLEEVSFAARIRNGTNIIKSFLNMHKARVVILMILEIGLLSMLVSRKRWLQCGTLLAGSLLIAAEFLYLGYRGRIVDRVAMAELALLAYFQLGMFIHNFSELRIKKSFLQVAYSAFAGIFMIFAVTVSYKEIQTRHSTYENCAVMTNSIRNYCHAHTENIYFEPAISISWHTYALSAMDRDFNNLMVLGGWNYSSPEWRQVLRSFGMTESVEETLLKKDNAYIVSAPENMETIIKYFEWKYGDKVTYAIVEELGTMQPVYVYDFSCGGE